MNDISISIIIPHYNSPHKLERLLASIPNRNDIQIIVVDDISTKDQNYYADVMARYSHVSFYENTINNKSAGGARNVGLENASGKWLLFADADDYFITNAFDIIDKYIQLESDVVFFCPTSMDESTGQESNRHYPYIEMYGLYTQANTTQEKQFAIDKMLFSWWVPWSRLISRKLVVENGIKFDVVRYSNDIMFSAKVGVVAQKVDVVADTIYCVTKGKESLVFNTNEDMNDIRVAKYHEWEKFVEEHYRYDELRVLRDLQSLHAIIVWFRMNKGFLGKIYRIIFKFRHKTDDLYI